MTYYIETVDNNWFRSRLNLFLFVVSLAFILLLARLFFLQIINGEKFNHLSEQNSTKFSRICPSRGLIFDRNGKLLVENRPSFDLCIDIAAAGNVEALARKVSSFTPLDFEELMYNFRLSKLSECKKYIILKSDIDRDSLAAIRVNRYGMPGIEVNITSKRNYIYGASLSHLLGYIGKIGSEDLGNKNLYTDYSINDVIGKCGIERSKEAELRGKCGGFWDQVDAFGQIVKRLDVDKAIPGYDVTLTIDHDLQIISESMFSDKMGALVAIDPSTGEVLSMVSSPSYDQNIFVSGISKSEWLSIISNPMKPFTNKAILGQYPPASIYKIITAVAGLEEDVVDEHAEILCKGFHTLGNRKYLCWKTDGHGGMDIVSALAESCDVFFYALGHRLGIDCLARYARVFGLGSSSGIDLENEAKGLVPTADWKKTTRGGTWQLGETLSVAIGQSSNLVTPLQMAIMVATIANGGYRYRPLVIKSIRESSGFSYYEDEPDILNVLSVRKKTIEIVQEGMSQAIKSDRGTARDIRSSYVEISGKTGTAQIISKKNGNSPVHGGENFTDHAWFVGYAPSDNPKIALAIIVEHGGNGSKVAAPIGASIFEYYLNKIKAKE